jgi:hypothetical protein
MRFSKGEFLMARNNDVILALNQQAQARQALGFDVTNGSIGMMYQDDGHLPVSSNLRGVLAKHTADCDLTYPSVAGGADYQNALRHWFLGEAFEEEAKARSVRFAWDSGRDWGGRAFFPYRPSGQNRGFASFLSLAKL